MREQERQRETVYYGFMSLSSAPTHGLDDTTDQIDYIQEGGKDVKN